MLLNLNEKLSVASSWSFALNSEFEGNAEWLQQAF